MNTSLRLVGQIEENDKTVGYLLFHRESQEVSLLDIEQTKEVIIKFGIENATINDRGIIIGTEGSLKRLPTFDINGKLTGKNENITILQVITEGDKIISYLTMSATGEKAILEHNDVVKLINKYGATNARISNRNGNIIISPIRGKFNKVDIQKVADWIREIEKEEER